MPLRVSLVFSTMEHFFCCLARDCNYRDENLRDVTALFTNMRILKFKSQLTIAFFTAVNHLNGSLRKQNFTLTGLNGKAL